MKSLLKPLVVGLDRGLARASLTLGLERPGLLTFMFHQLFESRAEAEAGTLDAFQPVTLEDFDRFIAHFSQAGYRFVGPDEILAGLDPKGRYAVITFDDGYANNLRALPILKTHGVPAIFFISAGHVRDGRAYWWDALFRRMRAEGAPQGAFGAEVRKLKALPWDEIEARLTDRYGEDFLVPLGETDRPMTAAELKAFAAEPEVVIGNHSHDHAILTALPQERARAQIRDCQDWLEEVTGTRPRAIAYPNGNHDARVRAIAAEEGLELAFATHWGRAALPLDESARRALPRHAIDGGPATAADCLVCRSPLPLVLTSRRLRASLGRRPAAA